MAGKLNPAAMQQLIRRDRGMRMTMSDDNLLVKQILQNHAPDGRDVDVKPILHIVENILRHANLPSDVVSMGTMEAQNDIIEDKTHQPGFISMLEALSYTIDRISCEIAYKALGGTEAHETTVSICNMVNHYKWDAKLVLVLAAFALNYGEFWLLAHVHSTNPLAKSMAILKQVPGIIEHAAPLKPRFDSLNELIKAILDVTRIIIEFYDLSFNHINEEVPQYATAMNHIPIAVYWSVKGVVACATQITSLTTMGYEFVMSTTEAWEISTLTHKLKTILEHLRTQLDSCITYIEERLDHEAYEMLRELFRMVHVDNMRVLRALIYSKDDILPLVDGTTKKRVNLDVLRRKNVLLLISGLDISHEELMILEQIYGDSKAHNTRFENPFELVWIPIEDKHPSEWTDAMHKQFETLQMGMTWYSVYHPSLISKAVIRFIRTEWNYRHKPILVVLDPLGRVASPNAIHMMWIWGNTAYPFTSTREEALWKEETWRLELLVDGIDQTVLNWAKDGKYIFLYGGDDIEWIRRFTTTAQSVAQAARIPLEMLYVGKSIKREQVKRALSLIASDNLSHSWQEPSMIWFFWTRLESMLFSKIQLKQADDHDTVMQEIKKILSYDKEGGWVVLAKGSKIVVNGTGGTALQTLIEYDPHWREKANLDGFDVGYFEHYKRLHMASHPCCRFEFPHAAGKIPDHMKCPECNDYMQSFTTFLCCHEEGMADELLYLASTNPQGHAPSTII